MLIKMPTQYLLLELMSHYFQTLSVVVFTITYFYDAVCVNNNSSWADAYNYLKDLLTKAQSGDEIRLTECVCRPNEIPGH